MHGKVKRIFGSGGIFVLGFAFFLMVSPARGDTLFDNLSQAGLGQGTTSNTYYKAQKFTTDAVQYVLASVTVRLRANRQGNLFVSIYDDSGDLPNAAVGTLNVPAIGAAYANYQLTPQGTVNLMPNTTYWVVVGVTSGAGDYDWNYTASNTGSGSGFSSRWAYTTNAGTTWIGNNNQPFIMAVAATPNQPIPTLNEWGVVALTLLFVGAFFVLRRRRKQTAQ